MQTKAQRRYWAIRTNYRRKRQKPKWDHTATKPRPIVLLATTVAEQHRLVREYPNLKVALRLDADAQQTLF